MGDISLVPRWHVIDCQAYWHTIGSPQFRLIPFDFFIQSLWILLIWAPYISAWFGCMCMSLRTSHLMKFVGWSHTHTLPRMRGRVLAILVSGERTVFFSNIFTHAVCKLHKFKCNSFFINQGVLQYYTTLCWPLSLHTLRSTVSGSGSIWLFVYPHYCQEIPVLMFLLLLRNSSPLFSWAISDHPKQGGHWHSGRPLVWIFFGCHIGYPWIPFQSSVEFQLGLFYSLWRCTLLYFILHASGHFMDIIDAFITFYH